MNNTAMKLVSWSFPDAASLSAASSEIAAHKSVKEWLPIRTCQRWELFALVQNDGPMAFNRVMHQCDGSDAATRLFAITAGALSEIPGEQAVAEQVRRQVRLALKRRQAGTVLAKLARRAMASGEQLRDRVRETTEILELPSLVANIVRKTAGVGGRGVVLLGAGAVGRSIQRSLMQAGIPITAWGTRRPRERAEGPFLSIESALNCGAENDIVIAALGEGATLSGSNALLRGAIVIDVSVPAVVDCPTLTVWDVIERSREALAPQREAVERAAHRLQTRAEAALAETLCRDMTAVNEAIARFRSAIVDAEYRRLAPTFERLPADDAERLQRSIRHTAARCVHPIHEYVNALARQGRADEARTVVDHLLGTRIGIMIDEQSASRCESPGIPSPGVDG